MQAKGYVLTILPRIGYSIFLQYLEQARNQNTDKVGLRANTRGSLFSKLNHVLRQAIKDQLITKHPSENIRRPKEQSAREYLTFEELEAMERAYSNQPHPTIKAFLFACYCGLRFSDVSQLRGRNVERNEIGGKVVYLLKYQQQKTQKNCYLPLSNKAIALIAERVKTAKSDDFILPLKSNTTANRILISRDKEKGNVSCFTAYVCRIEFAKGGRYIQLIKSIRS